MSDSPRVVEQGDVGKIFRRPGKVIDPARRNGHRMLSSQVIQNGEVVYREIRDYAHIAMKQAKIHPDRVVVVDLSEIAAADELAHLAHCSGIDEGVIYQQNQFATF